MNEQNLPQNFEGFSTAELVKMWAEIPTLKHTPRDPPGKVAAMRHLLGKYKLAPVHWGTERAQEKSDIIQSKKLLKPFGIDPAPWADEQGNRLPENSQTAST